MADADTKKKILETFQKFDVNGDGKISLEELKSVLMAIGSSSQFSDEDVQALLTASDTNKDGFIGYEEFVTWVTQDLEVAPPEFKPLDARGAFKVDYRKLLPERFEVNVSKRYDLDKLEIGAGGFGKVFIARDREFSDRMVAVKKVQKPSRSAAALSDLENEISVMKQLDHPNICKLLATFEEGRNMYFIMELCEGGEVFDRILETGSISEGITANIMQQVAAALAYAHGRGIAHRDIKPENVVFCTKERGDNRIKLIDWGLACDIGEMTKAVGSMTYAAPEVISSQDKKLYTEACDLWSMGVLAYVMLSGKPPFWGNREQHYKAARNERYPFKDSPWDRMNPDAKDLVKNLLKADPAQRLSITNVVQHAWLNQDFSKMEEQTCKVAQAEVLGNLKNFTSQSTFSRMCITAVARQLDHKHLKDIHQVFRAMDTDGNGVLSMEEISKGLKDMCGDTMSQAELEGFMTKLDMDGSHTIDYTEFCAAGLGAKTSFQEDVIWAAFKTFDLDNSGFVSVDNLRQVLDSADVKDVWSADVCNEVGMEIVAKYDKDKDGKISFDDWRLLMAECWNKSKTAASVPGCGIHAYDLMAKVNGLDVKAIPSAA